MTNFHAFNCITLAFGPYFLVYYATKLSEFGAYLVSLWAVVAYMLTQAAKMLILATVLPSVSESGWELSQARRKRRFIRLIAPQELVKALSGMFDLFGMHIALGFQLSAGISVVKVLGLGLGWSAAESLVTRLVPMFMGARSLEFDWTNLEMAIEANISLLLYISYAALAWVWGRRRFDRRRVPVLFMTLATYPVYLFVTSMMKTLFAAPPAATVLWQAGFAACIALVARHFHATWGKAKPE